MNPKQPSINLQLLCGQATWFFQKGNLAEAEQLCLQILAAEPVNFTAQHLLGVIRAQQGRNTEALELIGAALKITPNAAEALLNYGDVLKALGRFEEALASFDRALAINPDYTEALYNRGISLRHLKRFEEALASYDKVLSIKPDYAEALNNRGIILLDMKCFEEALASYDRALAIKPYYAEALYNRGIILWNLKRLEEALASYDRALAIKQHHAEALYNRGVTLSDLKRFKEALASFDRALAIKPYYAKALNNRGITLWNLKRPKEALASFDRALAIKPDYAEAWYNRGITLLDMKSFEEALASYDKALTIKPGDAEALYIRGDILRNLKRFDEALASYEKALVLDPDHLYAPGGAANTVLNLCDWPRAAKIAGEIEVHVRKSVVTPLTLLGYCGDAALQLQCAKRYISDRIPARQRPLWDGTVCRNDRIRIAYLSAEFNNHAVACLIAGLFERHDRSRFELSAISFGSDDGSRMRARIVRAFDHFFDVRGKSDHEVASFLKAAKVDIAIDLTGHTQDGRLGILSHRPCPVQVSYLGYPGTTGADFIDYVIGDDIVLPFDQQPFYTEKIVHLPDCYQVNDSRRAIAEETPSRAEAGLPGQGFVFCCFNNSWKITAPLFDIWMRLLGAVPGSVLWLIGDSSGASASLRSGAGARGIDPQRLVFATRVTPEEHLARHRLADLFLDTLPYNAHTTASDALWAGLPLVTCKGESFPGRVAASLLKAAGLPELVTDSLEAYEALALRLARDTSLLQSFRNRLGQNRPTCPLFDTDRFRRNIEAAYTTMWEISQQGKTPQSFEVQIDRPSFYLE